MSNITENRIALRVPFDRPLTEQDRVRRAGFHDFLQLLRKAGWVDENNVALREFKLSQQGHTRNKKYYIEWVARLQPRQSAISI